MEGTTWKALLHCLPLVDILNGEDVHFGERLRRFHQDLITYEWPRKTSPVPLGAVLGRQGGHALAIHAPSPHCGYSISEHSLTHANYSLIERPADELLLWLLVHTESEEVRQIAFYWVCVLVMARLTTRSAEPEPKFTARLKQNIQSLTPCFGQHPPAFHCADDRNTITMRAVIGAASGRNYRLQPPPKSVRRHLTLPEGNAPLLAHLESQIQAIEINFCEEVFRCTQKLRGWSVFTLSRYYQHCSVWHSKIDADRMIGSAEPSFSDSPDTPLEEPALRATPRIRAISDNTIQNGQHTAVKDHGIRRREVLASVFTVLKCTSRYLNGVLCEPPKRRFALACEPQTETILENALERLAKHPRIVPAPPHGGGGHSRSSSTASTNDGDEVHDLCVALCQELRKALLTLCGSADDVYALAWVDATAVNILKALGHKNICADLRWLKARWQLLDEIHTVYDSIMNIHDSVAILAKISAVFRPFMPEIDCYSWLVNTLNRIDRLKKKEPMAESLKSPLLRARRGEDDVVESQDSTITERIKGLASIACEFTSVQKSRSTYWVHIHPLIRDLVEFKPGRSTEQRVVSIPFIIHPGHIPVFRQIVRELLFKANVGPEDYCARYADNVLYSVLRDKSAIEDLDRDLEMPIARLYMKWEEFKAAVLFHENCVVTPHMLNSRADYFARQFRDGLPSTAVLTVEDLDIIEKLSKSAKFRNHVAALTRRVTGPAGVPELVSS